MEGLQRPPESLRRVWRRQGVLLRVGGGQRERGGEHRCCRSRTPSCKKRAQTFPAAADGGAGAGHVLEGVGCSFPTKLNSVWGCLSPCGSCSTPVSRGMRLRKIARAHHSEKKWPDGPGRNTQPFDCFFCECLCEGKTDGCSAHRSRKCCERSRECQFTHGHLR